MLKEPVKTTGSYWVFVSARLHYAGPDGQGSGSPFGNLAEADVTDLRGFLLGDEAAMWCQVGFARRLGVG
jgi:hypothetical protein